jgi:hypothetical protein
VLLNAALHGHVNWTPATYIGELDFQDFSPSNDLDFNLYDFTKLARSQRLSEKANFGRGAENPPGAREHMRSNKDCITNSDGIWDS